MTFARTKGWIALFIIASSFGLSSIAVSAPPAAEKKVWTKTECESVKRPDGSASNLWIPPGHDMAAVSGNYCFVVPRETTLQISLGGTTTISGLHNYINVAYKYALGLGVVVMIITIMVSGIQWMVSGMVDTINDAKQRIMNATLGLLLLFGAHTLLNTINPQLTQLRTPPIHAIRPDSFDTKQEGKRCDPGIENSCAQYGAQFKCKPTDYYAHAKCQAQLSGFMATVLGGAALAAIGPFLIPAGGAAVVTEQGAGHVIRQAAAEQIKDEAVEQSIDAVTNKNSLIAKGVLAVTGVSIAAAIYGDSEEKTDPAKGYCVELKPEKTSFAVCNYDGECQSGKCLITSTGACGAGKYGVCTSGAVREACLIPKSYSFGLIDALSNDEAAQKYKCNNVKCVDNGRGATKSGVGICSDGSDIGLPCSDEVACTGTVNQLTCVNGFCREKDYFSDGIWSDTDVGHPRCMLPTDCSDGISSKFWQAQGTQIVGCLKNPNKSLNLPARFLVPQINKAVDSSYLRELGTYGRCVTGNPYFVKMLSSSNQGTKIAQTCFVNVYPDKTMAKVGCGKGACGIFPGLVASEAAAAGGAVASIKGECDTSESNEKTYTKQTTQGPMLYVNTADKYYDGIKIPNIVDLQYSSAGAAN